MKKTAKKSLKPKKKTDKRATTLGPVEDLENYVPSDWWNCIFNSLYLKTDSDVVEDIHMTRKEVDLFSKIVDLKN